MFTFLSYSTSNLWCDSGSQNLYCQRKTKTNTLQDITFKMYQYMFSFVVFYTVNLFDVMTNSSW